MWRPRLRVQIEKNAVRIVWLLSFHKTAGEIELMNIYSYITK